MANTTSQIRIVFNGSAAGVTRAAAQAKSAIKGLSDEGDRLKKVGDPLATGLGKVVKGMAALGATSGAVQVVGGVAGALTQLAPAALLLPGALLGGAAAMSTFKIATAGFGDALKAGLSGDMAKFAEATKDMAPAMQDAAKAAVAFKPQIDALKKTVQGNFWAGFSGEIQKLGSAYLPVLKTGLGGIATSLGSMGKSLLGTLRQTAAVKDVNDILKGTSAFLDNAQFAAAHLAAGFLKIGAAGSQYLSGFGTGLGIATAKFRAWADEVVESGRIFDWIDGAVQGFKDLGAIVGNVGSIIGSVFTGLGGQISSPLANLRELTSQIATFLKTAEAQDGLRSLGETLRVVGEVVGKVVMTAFRELAPTLVALAPVAQEIARTLGGLLVGALQTLGPVVRGVAGVLGEFPGVLRLATVAVVGLVVAIKTMQAINAVSGWVSAASGALKIFAGQAAASGAAAEVASAKTDGFGKKLGGLKGIAAGVALGVVAVAMNDINEKAAGGAQNLQGFEENLNDISRILSGDWGNPFEDINAQLDKTKQNIQSGQSLFGQFLGSIKRGLAEKLPDMNFNLNTGPAAAQLDGFIAGVNKNAPTVNINGNANGAGFALREILREIAAGKAEVIIDGRPVPAQEALAYVIGLINNSNPEVNINGKYVKAGDALAEFLGIANKAEATATLKANPVPAFETVGGWQRRTEGTTGMAQMNANPVPANQVRDQWVGGVSRTRGTATLDANPGQANQQLGGWTGRANATTGTSKLNANPGQANSVTSGWVGAANRSVGTASLRADDSSARGTLGGLLQDWGHRILTWTVRIFGGDADASVGAVATSAGARTPVLTATGLTFGGSSVPRMTSFERLPRAAATGSTAPADAAAPQVDVQVYVDGQQLRSMVRTEITNSSRATRRVVLAGAGTTF